MKPNFSYVLFLIFLVGFLVRLYRFDSPIADWHSWRQADTSSVSRNFVEKGFDLLHPTFHDLSNIASGYENPKGYRFVEFPIFNLFQAGGFVLFGFFTLEQWGRLISIISSLLTGFFLYSFIRKYWGEVLGLLTVFFFLFLPFSIYYSRVILPDVMMSMAVMGAIYFFDRWIEGRSKIKNQRSRISFDPEVLRTEGQIKNQIFFLVSIIFTASALLLKPFAIFFVLPMLYLAWRGFGIGMLWSWQLWVFAIASVSPLIWWRQWMLQYPEGIPVNTWLFNGGEIRFRPAFFRWMLYERLTKLLLGYFGALLFIAGFLKQKKGDFLLPLSFGLSSILYVVVVARGNIQHDYYQIVLMPSIAIFLARGTVFLYEFLNINKYFKIFLISVIISLSFYFSWVLVKDYFNINNRAIVEAGKKADEVLPKDAKVIAFYNGDTSFLYQTKRLGWPSLTHSVDELIKKGATHIVIVNPTKSDFEGFGRQYETIAKSDKYLILKLK